MTYTFYAQKARLMPTKTRQGILPPCRNKRNGGCRLGVMWEPPHLHQDVRQGGLLQKLTRQEAGCTTMKWGTGYSQWSGCVCVCACAILVDPPKTKMTSGWFPEKRNKKRGINKRTRPSRDLSGVGLSFHPSNRTKSHCTLLPPKGQEEYSSWFSNFSMTLKPAVFTLPKENKTCPNQIKHARKTGARPPSAHHNPSIPLRSEGIGTNSGKKTSALTAHGKPQLLGNPFWDGLREPQGRPKGPGVRECETNPIRPFLRES